MEVPELPPVRARAFRARGADGVDSEAGGLRLTVYSELEGRDPSPLSLVAVALASCEALMFDMIAARLGAGYESVEVEAVIDFDVGYGAREARVVYRVRGLDRATAERVVGLVKRFCPIYRTFERAGVRLEEAVETA